MFSKSSDSSQGLKSPDHDNIQRLAMMVTNSADNVLKTSHARLAQEQQVQNGAYSRRATSAQCQEGGRGAEIARVPRARAAPASARAAR